METTFIYALLEPGTQQIRYVGKSDRPKSRFSFHIHHSKTFKSHLGNWLSKLETQGKIPDMEILEEVPKNQWGFWEREYIRVFRAIGFDLVNETEGGEGVGSGKENHMFGRTGRTHPFFGKTHSQEAREKMRATLRGPTSDLQKAVVSALHRGKIVSEETRQKSSESLKARNNRGEKNPLFGKKRSAEVCARISASHLARHAELRKSREE